MVEQKRNSLQDSYKSGASNFSNDRIRLASPPPSARLISQRRVNSDMHPLNESLHFDYKSTRVTKSATTGNNILEFECGNSKMDSSILDIDGNSYVPGLIEAIQELELRDILPYYLPFLSWIPDYCFDWFIGDFIGGLTLVFFQLPLSLSYATSLAHVPVTCGLLSLGISPLVYAVFGSVPQMVVGPEGAILLVVGQALEPLLHHSKSDKIDPVQGVVAISFISGASLLGFGLGRFGFLDNVLCASLLKGFIAGVGIVMIIGATVGMLGLEKLLRKVSEDPSTRDIHSPFDKLLFIIQYYRDYHPLTFKISITGFIFIMLFRIMKKVAVQKGTRFLNKAYLIPEILIVVSVSTVMCWYFDWPNQNIEVVGIVEKDSYELYNPLSTDILPLIKRLSTSGFLCAMLGFFESTTASKSLGSTYNLPISSNRELVALGFINIIGSVFGALPAFGGYGRSKINAMSAKTVLLSGIMGVITLIVLNYLLDYCYYIPKCMLNVITCVIGVLLLEEAPYELYFHWKSRGIEELITFFVTVLTTLFFSMEAGIAVGLVYLLIRVIKHSTESRIQILGRHQGTDEFVDADISLSKLKKIYDEENKGNTTSNFYFRSNLIEKQKSSTVHLNFFTDYHATHLNTEALEEIEGCLIIKIPEPLTFTNSNDLRARLRRVEKYGSTKAHPAAKRTRAESMTKYVVFDLNGMTEIDSSACQILSNLLLSYQRRDIFVFFARVNKSPKLRKRLKDSGITDILNDFLKKVNYYDQNQKIAYQKYTTRNSPVETLPYGEIEGSSSISSENNVLDLTESREDPYFSNIPNALKIIDYYEVHHPDIYRKYLDADLIEVRSLLAGDIA